MSHAIRLKRAYEPPSDDDGTRVLVDRIWPRGITKDHARIDLWLKDAAPSTDLRKWFGHQVDRWPEFRRRYLAELQAGFRAVELHDLHHRGDLTLVYAAKDELHNNAVVLAEHLRANR